MGFEVNRITFCFSILLYPTSGLLVEMDGKSSLADFNFFESLCPTFPYPVPLYVRISAKQLSLCLWKDQSVRKPCLTDTFPIRKLNYREDCYSSIISAICGVPSTITILSVYSTIIPRDQSYSDNARTWQTQSEFS